MINDLKNQIILFQVEHPEIPDEYWLVGGYADADGLSAYVDILMELPDGSFQLTADRTFMRTDVIKSSKLVGTWDEDGSNPEGIKIHPVPDDQLARPNDVVKHLGFTYVVTPYSDDKVVLLAIGEGSDGKYHLIDRPSKTFTYVSAGKLKKIGTADLDGVFMPGQGIAIVD